MTDKNDSAEGSDSGLGLLGMLMDDDFIESVWEYTFRTAQASEYETLRMHAKEGAKAIESPEVDEDFERERMLESIRDITLFFLFATALAEDLMPKIVHDRVISPEFRSPETREALQGCLQYRDAQNLLYRCGIIDNGTNSELSQAKKIRNKFAHGSPDWLVPSRFGNPSTQIDRAHRAITTLLEIYQESRHS